MARGGAARGDRVEVSDLGIGGRIREARLARGMSLRTLAGVLEVSPATLSQVETGKTAVSALRLARIAEVLGVAVQALVPEAGARRGPATGPPPTSDEPVARHLRQRAETVRAVLAGNGDDWRVFPPLALDAVLSSALTAFAERGYHGCSMRDIAAGADMSVPGLYHHYPSKQEMLATLLDIAGVESYERAVRARDDGGGGVERFARVVESMALFNTHRLEFARIGVAERRNLAPENRERITALRLRIQSLFDTEIAAGVASGELRTAQAADAGRAVIMLCTGLANWFRPDGPVTAEEVARTYTGFALGIVGADERPRS
ncbi:TetR family transcriptional regulator [Pseudonocardia abyssalis]|uniref:TetR family transcriptional regulator n=1 Tax=Pseudonocardia abyssalis TaxID=2792008 RepID=A0ABS6UR83_9PSEU|nr:TetR family transcriptional regulator [Pseudonocardia abyssalis]MBW0119477.1 TetR family transcriptional regulator [Pseudonocardia abyssalis]MBW0134768.1 TetR family transcriptional regulator [Pseudonocardia abyssalis]